jgi:hypothetical protein
MAGRRKGRLCRDGIFRGSTEIRDSLSSYGDHEGPAQQLAGGVSCDT